MEVDKGYTGDLPIRPKTDLGGGGMEVDER